MVITSQTNHTSKKPIVFFGTEDFSLESLKGLINSGYNIAAVVTKPDSKKGRGQTTAQPSVKKLAIKHNILVWQPDKLTDIIGDIKKLDSPAGILVSFGKIIPQSVIELFEPGIINVHPSLLPAYRGPSPIESAITDGIDRTGVTIMQLSPKMDAGPIYGQMTYNLDGKETKPALYETMAKAGAAILLSLLPSILDGTLKPKPQNEQEATYCKLLTKQSAWLDTSKINAEQAERLVRANLGFPKSKIKIDNQDIIVTSAHVADSKTTPLDIEFINGSILSIDSLIVPNSREMTAKAYLSGHNKT